MTTALLILAVVFTALMMLSLIHILSTIEQ